jgi:hypothetical protein
MASLSSEAMQYESRIKFSTKILNMKRIRFIFGEMISYWSVITCLCRERDGKNALAIPARTVQ